MSGSAEPRRPAPARQVLEPLMTVEDLAAYLHKPVNTICKMRAEGTGSPGYRVGKHLLFKQLEVAEWLEDHRDEI
jgi:excisionase family DNA binding protein